LVVGNQQASEPEAGREPSQSGRVSLIVPLIVDRRVLGLLHLEYDQAVLITSQQTDLARLLANQAAVAMENARLYEDRKRATAWTERRRLARDLHDSLAQALFAIVLNVESARDLVGIDVKQTANILDVVHGAAESSLADVRALISELYSECLETDGLVQVLSRQAATVAALYGVRIDTDLGAEPTASLAAKEAAFRIAQEALNNAAQHARARLVNLEMCVEGDAMVLDVRDDGIGFDSLAAYPGHLGLTSMRERAAGVGGSLSLQAVPGFGAWVHAEIPLAAPAVRVS
jgi:signal transduction histidine kinase